MKIRLNGITIVLQGTYKDLRGILNCNYLMNKVKFSSKTNPFRDHTIPIHQSSVATSYSKSANKKKQNASLQYN